MMAVDLGTAASIAAIAIPAAAVVITVIKTKSPHNGNGNGKLPAFPCAEHSGIKEALKSLSDGQARIEKSLERIFHLHDEGKL